MNNSKIFIVFLFSIFSATVFSQQKKKKSLFEKIVKEKSEAYAAEKHFKKAQFFFLEKEWDSTLVYTTKQLNTNSIDPELKNYCYFFRGFSFQKKKIFKEALKEYEKISKDFVFYNHAKMFLGEIHLELEEYLKAIRYFKEIEQLKSSEILGLQKVNLEHNLGLSYFYLKKFDEAESYLLKSTQANEKANDTLELVGSYADLGNLYYEQYKDDQAIPYFKKAYNFSKKANDFNLKQNMALNMAVVEENRKDFIKALTYRKEFEQWKDSVNNQNRIYETAQLEKKIAVEKKQREVRLLQAENRVEEAQKRVFLYSGILLLILLTILFFSYRGKVKRNKIITIQKEDLDELNATKDKLFSIVSHDLRSSVNAIKTSNKSLLNNLETDNTTDLKEILQQNSTIVNGAYGLLDNLLNWALLQTKQSYFEINSLRLSQIVEHVAYNYKPLMIEKNIVFENTVDKKHIIKADQESLKIILRNLLDNAIKFSKPEGSIQMYSREQPEFYDLIVEDTGIGMNESTINELLKNTQLLSKKRNEEILGTGLGLHLVKSMIEKNHGKFAIESVLGKGTKMMISLPKER